MPVLSTRRCNPVVVGCALIVTERCFWRRLTVLKSGTCQSRPASLSRLCAMPIAWRKARLNKPLIVKQNWIAASLYFRRRPRLPLALPCQHMALSNQIRREPRAFSEVL